HRRPPCYNPPMSLRISNVRLSIDEPEAALPGRMAQLLGLPAGSPPRYRILRKALDARDSRALQFVYTAEAHVEDEQAVLARFARRRGHSRVQLERYQEEPFILPPPVAVPPPHRPVVVGNGPRRLAAACLPAQPGYR